MRVALLVLLVVISACGSDRVPAPVDAAEPDGAALFTQPVRDGRPGCVACHSLEPDVVLVGPSLAGVTERSGVDDIATFLRTSTMNPDLAVREGFEAGLMPQADLTEAEVSALVSYLIEVGS